MKKVNIVVALIAFLSVPFIASATGTDQKPSRNTEVSKPTYNGRNPLDVNIDIPDEPPINSTKSAKSQQYSMFPNPATNGNFRISAATEFEYTITDLQGKEISKGFSSQQIALVQLPESAPRSVYSVLLKNSNGTVTVKRIVKA
jgi:hypothetical protein